VNVVLLTGPHGSGKSTIGRAVMAQVASAAVRAIFADDGSDDAYAAAPNVVEAVCADILKGL
jgi:uridine kinase